MVTGGWPRHLLREVRKTKGAEGGRRHRWRLLSVERGHTDRKKTEALNCQRAL